MIGFSFHEEKWHYFIYPLFFFILCGALFSSFACLRHGRPPSGSISVEPFELDLENRERGHFAGDALMRARRGGETKI